MPARRVPWIWRLFAIVEVPAPEKLRTRGKEALAPAQRRLAREINPTAFPCEEFALKVRAGNHVLATVLKQAKLFLIGGGR